MVEPGHRWLEPALHAQSAVAGVATAGFCIFAFAGLQAGLLLQMAILLTGIVLVGFPHGAFDHYVARPILSARLGPTWWAFFLAGYLSLAGLVWAAWIIAPAVTLAGFLAATVFHFGLGDTEDEPSDGRVPRWIKVLTCGSLPVLLPVAVHPGAAAPVLAAMGDIAPAAMRHVLASAVWLLPIWVAAFAWVEATGWRRDGGLLGRLLAITGFVMLPPLLAFGLYFALSHSAKHLLRIMAWHNAQDLRVACLWAARVVVPASIVCAIGLAGLAWIGDNSSIDILAQSFKVIGALTLPHIIVTTWLDRPAPSATHRIVAVRGWPATQAEQS
jgi:Brp/Blh family beta-carotene 15,15'-monooxygenase